MLDRLQLESKWKTSSFASQTLDAFPILLRFPYQPPSERSLAPYEPAQQDIDLQVWSKSILHLETLDCVCFEREQGMA